MKKKRLSSLALLAVAALAGPSCATLGNLANIVHAPRISAADGRPAELRLAGGSGRSPFGATLRVWARVENPNAFGLTLSTVEGALFLQDEEAAEVTLPLGLPLGAREETVVPIDITIDLRGVPGLARALASAVAGAPVQYRLDGLVGIDAGDFGTPTFGPMTEVEGDVRVR
jgi:hypothetical protein